MSKTERRTDAREKARRMREAAEAKARRQRRLAAGGAVAGVLAVVVGVGAVVQSSRSSSSAASAAAEPANVVDGGIVTGAGDAPVTVSVYLDYLCPACAQFEASEGPWLKGLADEGAINLEHKPIAILDRYSSTQYSTRSANAAACVADSSPEAFADFTAALMAAQPAEGGDGLPDSELASIAQSVGASGSVESCIAEGEFTGWVASATEASSQAGIRGTPTVLVDGEVLADRSRPALEAAIAAAG